MEHIFIGTEAVAKGVVTSHQLRRWYRPIYPNVHAPRDRVITLGDRTKAAWLWSGRKAIITGPAAAALHGSRWVDDDVDTDLIYKCPRPPAGIVARNERIESDEWQELQGLSVANPVRTAFDLGRFQRRHNAVAQLDALMRVRPYALEDVMVLAKRYRGRHGVARLKAVLPLVDGGAMSPRETFWRLLVIDAGFPRPTTQIPVLDEFGQPVRVLDFGWEDFKVALEYDGDQHQSDREQYLKDRRVLPELERLGWTVIGIVKEDDPVDVIHRLHGVMTARGWRGRIQIPAYAYSRWGAGGAAGIAFRV